MALYGSKWLDFSGNGWNLSERAVNIKNLLAISGNGNNGLKALEMAKNNWKLLESCWK